MLTATWQDGSSAKSLFKYEAGQITVPLAELQAGSGSWLSAAKRYTALGIEHILLGFDHLMFVLALLLIVRGPWMLVKTITAFTIAHSITLGLATLGFINMPSRPVEAAIALSIMFLCVEIVHAHQGKVGMTFRYPWLVAFAFGLLHGLGFAGALSDIGLPQSEIPIALLFFNIGVEVGQLIFVAAVLLLAWMLRGLKLETRDWVRVVPTYLIGTLASYWFLERLGSIVFQA
jgi:hydrogenase/urease accessory protein HupE